MMHRILVVLTFLLSQTCNAGFFDWFSSKPETPEDRIAALQKKQVDSPNDPAINYNVGVAFYKNEQFNQARKNFTRALEYTTDQTLKKQTMFNLGNSCYKDCLSQLPKNWEKPDTQIENILQLIAEAKEAIKHYKDLQVLDPEHVQAKTNLKKAEELLKKLEKKMQQQQQQNKDDKKDNKKDDKKDNKKDQKNQDQQDKDQQSQQGDSKDQEKDGSQQGDKSQEQSGGKDKSDESGDMNQQGKDQKSDQDQGKNKEQKDSDHKDASGKDQQSDKQSEDTAGESGTQEQEKEGQEAGSMAAGKEEKEGMEMKGMRAVLESVQADESKTQKQLIMQKVNAGQPPATNQKPW